MLSRRSISRCALAALLFFAMAAAGCGKKGDPIPPRFTPPPAIAGLAADSVAEGILLGWPAPGPIGGIDHFRIVRGEASADKACPGCPQEYRPLATPKVNDQALRRTGEGMFGYLDGAVTEDRFYSYRVSACDSRGHCGEPSAPVNRLRERR
jgi:predicted small lipoprotein YifL